jgi:hypothetical protein
VQGSQQSASAQTAATQKAPGEATNKEFFEKYEKEFIAHYGDDKETSLTSSHPSITFTKPDNREPYVGLTALLTKQRNIVILAKVPLEKRLKRLLRAHVIKVLEDPTSNGRNWIACTPEGKNNAKLLYAGLKVGFDSDYLELHLLGFKDDAIKKEYARHFEVDKKSTQDWLQEQAGTSEWKQLEDAFKALDTYEIIDNGNWYLEGFMARKSDEEILKGYYNRFEKERKETLAWIKRVSAKLKLVP